MFKWCFLLTSCMNLYISVLWGSGCSQSFLATDRETILGIEGRYDGERGEENKENLYFYLYLNLNLNSNEAKSKKRELSSPG